MSRIHHYNPPLSQRLPAPAPPPKPKYFESRMPEAYEGRQHYKDTAVETVTTAPPADSDTDSGICADSEQSSASPSSQQNSGHTEGGTYKNTVVLNRYPAPSGHSSTQYRRQLEEDQRDYLTPNSARRLFEGIAVPSPRRLPARPTIGGGSNNGHAPANGQSGITGNGNGGSLARNGTNGGKQFRVRFADQITPGGSTLPPSSVPSSFPSSLSSSPSTSSASPRVGPPRNNGYDHSYPQVNGTSNGQYYKRPASRTPSNLSPEDSPFINYDSVNERRPDPTRGYSIDDVEGLPEPPSYSVAVQRIRDSMGTMERSRSRSRGGREGESGWTTATPRESVRDTVIRQSIEDTLRQRQLQAEQRHESTSFSSDAQYMRNRSSSLPRGRRSEGEIQPLWQHCQMTPSTLATSVDNLHINGDNYSNGDGGWTETGSLPRRRCLPPLPPLNGQPIQETQTFGRRPAYSRQRRCRGGVTEMISRRSASVGRYPTLERSDRMYPETLPSPVEYPSRSMESPVRAQLIALDHRGFRTVLIEKVQPGPFGFYIATGVVNGQRGIFISRVSIASLTPILSIGDEIVYVDDELVKGRSLEYVQSLIAGKTAVTIVLLPTVGPAMC